LSVAHSGRIKNLAEIVREMLGTLGVSRITVEIILENRQ
jgi:hypothetical protein